MINPDLQEDCGRGGYRCRAKCPDPYTVRYANLNRYVAVSLSVPNCFDFLTADSRPDLCGKPSCSWRIVSSDLGELLVNPSGLMKSIRLPFSSCLNARDGGQLQVEFLHHRMTHLGCVLQTILTGREQRQWRAESVPRLHPYFSFTRQIAVRGGLVDGNVAGK